jgi:phosphopantothenoylcysteine decarboxylase/phosphopantothenate--cysteine ligase
MAQGRRILLLIGGGIAAYKCLDLIRRLREQGARVRVILTKAGSQFVTPLALATLSGERVFTDLFSLTDEVEIGHIELSREADLVLVAPATADLIAKMAAGLADDLGSTALLATDKPVLLAPAMNVRMWRHPATQRNLETVRNQGALIVGPNEGEMACGEFGPGRMAEPAEILAAIEAVFGASLFGAGKAEPKPLKGRKTLVTSGPTFEPIDPVRLISNRSSGKQGHAIAKALADLGADCVLISGPTALADPKGVRTVKVETAREMLAACEKELPLDCAVLAAAVTDWRVARESKQKFKRNGPPPPFELIENPDILETLSRRNEMRPALVVGFAAETENVAKNAMEKRRRKGCDWILANRIGPGSDSMGGEDNEIAFITGAGIEEWPRLKKSEIAARLAERIAAHFAGAPATGPRAAGLQATDEGT